METAQQSGENLESKYKQRNNISRMLKHMGELNDVFERRWHTLELRSTRQKITLPPKEQLRKLLYQSFSNGFKCDYCQTQLKIKDAYPYHSVFSFEHKKSIHCGGDNNIENLSVVCHRCNVTKGPMSEETWRAIIEHLPPELFNRMCNELFSASISKELKRQGLSRDEKE